MYGTKLPTNRKHTRPIHQTPYLTHKRTREEWDPTLWEVPLQLLPKRQKAH